MEMKLRMKMKRIMSLKLKWVEIGLKKLGMEDVIEEMTLGAEMGKIGTLGTSSTLFPR